MKNESKSERIEQNKIDEAIREKLQKAGGTPRVMSASCYGGGGGTTSNVPGCASKNKKSK